MLFLRSSAVQMNRIVGTALLQPLVVPRLRYKRLTGSRHLQCHNGFFAGDSKLGVHYAATAGC